MRIAFIQADKPSELNCSMHLCVFPANAINKLKPKHEAVVISFDKFLENSEEVQKNLNNADIILIERNFFQGCLPVVGQYISRGKILVAQFDDAYHKILSQNASYSFWKYGRVSDGNGNIQYIVPEPLTQFKIVLRMVKALITVSEQLRDDWQPYVKSFFVPYYLNLDRYKNAKPLYDLDGKILIGWQGSLSHVESFKNSGLLEALTLILKKYPQVRVIFGGDKRNYDLFKAEVGFQKIFHPFVPENVYGSLLSTYSIALAPLATDYDRYRSRIKALEYCYLKIPWIASNYPAYAEMKDFGTLVENTPESWYNSISDMIDHLPQYQERANTIAYDFACSQDIDLHIEDTLKLYQQIIDMPYTFPEEKSVA